MAGLILKPLALLSPLVTTPLLVRYLNKEGFGLFTAIVGFAMLLGLSNIGMQQGLVNRLIDCHVSGDRALARRYISSLTVVLGAVMLAMLLFWTGAATLVPWGSVFKVHDARAAHETPWVVWITGVSVLAGLVLMTPSAVYVAHQEHAIAYRWEGAGRIATLLACIAVVYTPFGLIGVAVAASVTPVLVQG